MSQPDVAVIIVTYKCASLTIESLKSLVPERSQPGVRIRAIVVDNASGDYPEIEAAIAANGWSSWVTLLLAPKNGGFAYGNNFGAAHAYGQTPPTFVYLLNPDAQIRPGAIVTLVNFLERNPDAAIAGSKIENEDGSDWSIAFRFPTAVSEMLGGLEISILNRLLSGWMVARRMNPQQQRVDWICGASMLIRGSVFAALGGMDENYFLYFEETDFCRRAKSANLSTWYVPESRVMHITGQSTKVTDVRDGPKRLPGYWFESRRRYFAVTYGLKRAILIDLVAIVANALGNVKRLLAWRRHTAVPYFVRDLTRHSIMRLRNRELPALRGFNAAKP